MKITRNLFFMRLRGNVRSQLYDGKCFAASQMNFWMVVFLSEAYELVGL